MSNNGFRGRTIWVENNDIEAAIKLLRQVSRDARRKLRRRQMYGGKPRLKKNDKRWFGPGFCTLFARDEKHRRQSERQRTLAAAWGAALERQRAGAGPSKA